MDIAHVHLVLTHIPVLGTVFGLMVLIYAIIRGNADIMVVSLWTFVLSGLAAVATYFTGEGAEDIVEKLPGVSESIIEVHQDFAGYALFASALLGLIALGGLWLFWKRKLVPAWLGRTVLVLSIVVSAMMAWTATLGGRINHPEIRPASHAQVQTGQKTESAEQHESDD